MLHTASMDLAQLAAAPRPQRPAEGPAHGGAFVLVWAFSGGLLAANTWLAQPPAVQPGRNGFDLRSAYRVERPLEPREAPVAASRLMPLRGGSLPLADLQVPQAATLPTPASPLDKAARRGGARVSAFTTRFRERHPVMRQYSRLWMSYPDLKKLNDDYMRDRDLARFVRGLTAAPSLQPLVRRIAADPASHRLAVEFLAGAATEAPAELVAAACERVGGDRALMGLVERVASAVDVPLSMLPGLDR